MAGLCPTVTGINSGNINESYTSSSPCVTCTAGWENMISATGTVNDITVATFVTDLLSRSGATSIGVDDFPAVRSTDNSNPNPAKEYAQHTKDLRQNIKNEYCFYYSRYLWGMQKILISATQQGSAVDPAFKSNVQTLNNKLNTILAVMKGIVNSRMTSLKEYSNNDEHGVNSLNTELDRARISLAKDSHTLQTNDLNSDIQSSMIDYSLEKNEASRNMLAMYGFMNIVAVGLLFYLYTHIK